MRLLVSDRSRKTFERLLRVVATLTLLMLLAIVMQAARSQPIREAEGSAVPKSLALWSTREAPRQVHVSFNPAPTPEMRDWLGAIARAGTQISWDGIAPAPAALAVEPVADPWRPTRVWIAAPPESRVLLRDKLGVIDTAIVARVGARLVLPQLEGTLHAGNGKLEATSAERDSLLLRSVLILAQAGWEAKFTAAALEEHGWSVESRLAVSPDSDVRQGPERLLIDTARYAAVIALDSVADRYASQLARYVRAGGGLIAAGDAAALSSLATILPATVIDEPTLPGVFARRSGRDALSLAPLGRMKAGAVALEKREQQDGRDAFAAAAWRVGGGRTVQIGYQDIWRWRLAVANPEALQEHRQWWAQVVSAVAYAPRVPVLLEGRLEPTPLASHVEALGPATERITLRASLLDDPRLLNVLFAVLVAALLLEWASRRLRGAR